MLATTMGAGIFAIPALLPQAGWLVVLVYGVALSALLAIAHLVYLQVRAHNLNQGFLSLIAKAWGRSMFLFGFFVVVGGLILTLLVYLILGGQFLQILFPHAPLPFLVFTMWLFGIAPFVLGTRRLLGIEFAGAIVMGMLILFVLWDAPQLGALTTLPAIRIEGIFLPFGVLFFALAGWTAVEPTEDSLGLDHQIKKLGKALTLGTFATLILYALFAWAVVGSGGGYGAESFLGANWGEGQLGIFGFLGLILLLTSFWPIALEIQYSFRDIAVPDLWNNLLTFGAPLFLYFLGWQNFLTVMEVVGGVFLSLQYFLIVFLGLKFLRLTVFERWGLRLLSGIFLLGVLASLWG